MINKNTVVLSRLIMVLALLNLMISNAQNPIPLKNSQSSVVIVNNIKPRRGTSQGLPNTRLHYTPGKPVKYWSLATAASIMARYPDYREAYWKPWSYVQG